MAPVVVGRWEGAGWIRKPDQVQLPNSCYAHIAGPHLTTPYSPHGVCCQVEVWEEVCAKRLQQVGQMSGRTQSLAVLSRIHQHIARLAASASVRH